MLRDSGIPNRPPLMSELVFGRRTPRVAAFLLGATAEDEVSVTDVVVNPIEPGSYSVTLTKKGKTKDGSDGEQTSSLRATSTDLEIADRWISMRMGELADEHPISPDRIGHGRHPLIDATRLLAAGNRVTDLILEAGRLSRE